MIVFESGRFLAVAAAVWAVWRVVLWRRRDETDWLREAVAAVLFVTVLAIVHVTLFPLYVIFYDWSGRFSLVPFASILQLLRETNDAIAFRNIAGNFVLLMPLGVLLPLLFTRMRTLGAAVWRLGAISLTIETMQFVTRARSVDIDDVLLNTSGAILAWGIYTLGARLVERRDLGRRLLDRVGAPAEREPLRAGAIPIGVTLLIVVPIMLTTIVGGTMGERGIVDDITAGWADGQVVARVDVGRDAFLMASNGTAPETLRLYSYNKVLPGRFAREAWSDLEPDAGSRYGYSITTFNVVKAEWPTVYLWGVNEVGAATMTVTGHGLDEVVTLPEGDHFLAAFTFRPNDEPILSPFVVRFFTADGTDVSERIPSAY